MAAVTMVAAAASAPHRNFAVPELVGNAVKKSFGKHSGTRVLVKNASNDISFESIVQYKSYDSLVRPQLSGRTGLGIGTGLAGVRTIRARGADRGRAVPGAALPQDPGQR